MTHDTRQAIQSFLSAHSTLTLATVAAEGAPQAASLFFVADAELRLYWASGSNSRHSRNIVSRQDVAVTVHNETWSWTEIAGVQLEGAVTVVPAGPAWQAVWELYLAKFPFVRDFQDEVARSNFYVLTPRWARLIDNSQGFGYKSELSF